MTYIETELMSMGPNRPVINRTYKSTTPLQWLRELIVNSIQAKATRIFVTTEWQAVEQLGAYRRMIVDNGTGIPRSEILRFLNKYGGSGQLVGETDDNFGIGFKVASLPWNHYGIIAISRHQGETTLVWMHYDAKKDGYGARGFDIGDEDAPVFANVVPLDEFDEYVIDGVDYTKVFTQEEDGLAVILAGMNPEDHTVLGDPNRQESQKYALVRYLNSRLFDIPEGVEIKIDKYEPWANSAKVIDPKGWPKSAADLKARSTAQGLRSVIDKAGAVQASGVVSVPGSADMLGANIGWKLYEAPATKGAGDRVVYPLVGINYASHKGVNEMYHLAATGDDTLDKSAGANAVKKFVQVAPVRDRLVIVITLPENPDVAVGPDAGRTRLFWETKISGAQELPWDAWLSYWQTNLPTEIRTAVEEYYASLARGNDGGLTDDDYRKLSEVYLSAMTRKVPMLLQNPRGDKLGIPSDREAGEGERGGVNRKRKRKGGENKVDILDEADRGCRGKEREVKLDLIKVLLTSDKTEEDHLIDFDQPNYTATVNVKHPQYVKIRAHIVGKQTDKGNLPGREHPLFGSKQEIVITEIGKTIQRHVSLSLTDIFGASKRTADPDSRTAMLHPAALANVLSGIKHIEDMSSGYIGTALAGHRKIALAA